MKIANLENQEFYNQMFYNAPYGMMLIDDKTKTIDSNQKACELLGYSREDLNKLNAKDIIHPFDIDKTPD